MEKTKRVRMTVGDYYITCEKSNRNFYVITLEDIGKNSIPRIIKLVIANSIVAKKLCEPLMVSKYEYYCKKLDRAILFSPVVFIIVDIDKLRDDKYKCKDVYEKAMRDWFKPLPGLVEKCVNATMNNNEKLGQSVGQEFEKLFKKFINDENLLPSYLEI